MTVNLHQITMETSHHDIPNERNQGVIQKKLTISLRKSSSMFQQRGTLQENLVRHVTIVQTPKVMPAKVVVTSKKNQAMMNLTTETVVMDVVVERDDGVEVGDMTMKKVTILTTRMTNEVVTKIVAMMVVNETVLAVVAIDVMIETSTPTPMTNSIARGITLARKKPTGEPEIVEDAELAETVIILMMMTLTTV